MDLKLRDIPQRLITSLVTMRRLAAWLHQCFVSPLIKGAVPLGRIVFKLFNGVAK